MLSSSGCWILVNCPLGPPYPPFTYEQFTMPSRACLQPWTAVSSPGPRRPQPTPCVVFPKHLARPFQAAELLSTFSRHTGRPVSHVPVQLAALDTVTLYSQCRGATLELSRREWSQPTLGSLRSRSRCQQPSRVGANLGRCTK